MRTVASFMIVLAVLGSIGCASNSSVSTSIGAAANRGPGTRIALAEHAAFAWDRVCIFGPYTPDDKIDAVTGISGAAARAYDIRSNDGIDVLMFLDQSRIVDSVAHSRGRADFGPELVGRCYSRDRAVFAVRTPPSNSWGNIGPS